MSDARREAVERMFRARLSWSVIGGVGLIGLTAGISLALRGVILAGAVVGFLWLNQPLLAWIVAARRLADARWQPMAVGMALRVIAFVGVLAVSW